MIKRVQKITSLILAASSVACTFPTISANAATRLGTREGNIEKAFSFKDGKYLYQGYRTDDDDSGLYYNSGTKKDKPLDDATELGEKFNEKYASAFDGSDEYVIDLSTGKIDDDDTLSDSLDTAKTKLRNKLKKTDRYDNDNVTITSLENVFKNTFDETWYLYKAEPGTQLNTTVTTTAAVTVTTNTTTPPAVTVDNVGKVEPQPYYYGFTSESGTKYIDCSHKENLYVYNGSKMVKLEEVGDTEKASDSDASDVTLNSVTPVKALGQDDKYIYLLIKANITGAKKLKPDDKPYKTNDDLYYVQKISKAQGDKEKDAYIPKSIASYEISEFLGNGDAKDAYDDIMNISNKSDAVTKAFDNSLYITYTDDDKVKTKKINLKTSEKLNEWSSSGSKESSKIDGHVAIEDTDVDTDIEESDPKSWSVDVNGVVWAIDGGKIKKSVKCGSFETVYTCDRSLNSIDVYDSNNLIAWDDSNDAYTTVQEGITQAYDDAVDIVGEPVAPVIETKKGWEQLANGNWNFYDATGKLVVSSWSNIGGTWYYFDAQGSMVTGWIQLNGIWYYLNPISDGTKGAMKTGWIQTNGIWYYLSSSGAMKTGWIDLGGTWYYLDGSGAMKTGWIQDGGKWYYLNSDGSMAYSTTIDGYRLSSSGAMI
ncbi:MAG: N-acetylmuramoyl-L-alanine amidase family protein [Clostridium sp.]|nr:N-acetylmuramoyl-L-alanine amidase family protein [Clostridium sp.]